MQIRHDYPLKIFRYTIVTVDIHVVTVIIYLVVFYTDYSTVRGYITKWSMMNETTIILPHSNTILKSVQSLRGSAVSLRLSSSTNRIQPNP